jgi:transposase
MPHTLNVASHLPADELYHRYRQAERRTEQGQWHILWLKSRGRTAAAVREVLGYSKKWICEVVHRDNEGGPKAVRDRRRDHPGAEPMLSPGQQAELAGLLEGPAPNGEPWNGPKVARWIESVTGREEVHNQRGWEYLRRFGFTPQRPRRRQDGGAS